MRVPEPNHDTHSLARSVVVLQRHLHMWHLHIMWYVLFQGNFGKYEHRLPARVEGFPETPLGEYPALTELHFLRPLPRVIPVPEI